MPHPPLLPNRGDCYDLLLLFCSSFSFLEQCEPPHDMLLCPPEKQRFAPRKSNHLPQKVLSFSRNPRYNKGIVCIFSDSGKEFCRFWGKVCYYNLSPQGDGNAHRRLTSSLRENYNLSPQGDGNLLVLVPADVANDYNLSPQGDKKAPLPLAFASSGGALLFLIFYFTGWELRLPESSL